MTIAIKLKVLERLDNDGQATIWISGRVQWRTGEETGKRSKTCKIIAKFERPGRPPVLRHLRLWKSRRQHFKGRYKLGPYPRGVQTSGLKEIVKEIMKTRKKKKKHVRRHVLVIHCTVVTTDERKSKITRVHHIPSS